MKPLTEIKKEKKNVFSKSDLAFANTNLRLMKMGIKLKDKRK